MSSGTTSVPRPCMMIHTLDNQTSGYKRQDKSVRLKLRASLYEAQMGLGAHLVSAKHPPPPCASLAPNSPPPRAPR